MSDDAPWPALRRFTEARIGLGRAGSALPIKEVLSFAMAHAQARDAVTTPIDWAPIETEMTRLGLPTVRVDSAATDRDTYLRRPDLGRRLGPEARQRLAGIAGPAPDLLIVIADGLSSTGVAANAADLIGALLPLVRKSGWTLGPIVLASQGRVALGDDAAEVLGARAVLVLIGERPGLSSPDSLGAYLTYAPPRRPQGRRAQLRLQHPPRRPRCGRSGLQDQLAPARSIPACPHRRRAEGRKRLSARGRSCRAPIG